MSQECCSNRPNFGRPACPADWGDIVGLVLAPLKDSNRNQYAFIINTLTYNVLLAKFTEDEKNDRLYDFPNLEDVEYVVADSLKQEGASGRTAFLRKGKITLNGSIWLGSGGSITMAEKIAELRCQGIGLFFKTSNNMLIGREISLDGEKQWAPIPVDEQSIDPKFMFKTNSTNQMVGLTLDLDRNFNDSTYYAIPCDNLWDSVSEITTTLDLQNLPQVIDCELLEAGILTTATSVAFSVNDDYRQGARNENNTNYGNVTGLVASDFLVTNVTDLTVITPTSVVEEPTGFYIVSYLSQTSGDKIKIDLVLSDTNVVNYNGSMNYLIP